MLRPQGTLVGAAVWVSMRSLGSHRAGAAAGPLMGFGGFCHHGRWQLKKQQGTAIGVKRALAFPLSRR